MAKTRVAQVAAPKGKFEVVEREFEKPSRNHVRIAIEACGICHSDSGFVEGRYPGLKFPVVAGHEIAGRVEEVGDGVEGWQKGDRVAVGWFGGHCVHANCASCREGDFIHCEKMQVPGWAYPGGFAESITVPANAMAKIPDALSFVEAAPMGCAGVTTFNALRTSVARAGDVVAILGIGGLGHLGVQFASKMGFETVAIARGRDKEALAKKLGAHHYIDSEAGDVAQKLMKLGGAKVVLATATSAKAMAAATDGVRANGELITVGVSPEPLGIASTQLIRSSRTVHGHPSGTSRDVEDTMRFAALQGIRPMIEVTPLSEVASAYERMMSGQAKFRMVLTMK